MNDVTRRLLHNPVTWSVIAVLAVGAAFGLYWFQPWKLVTNKQISDPIPSVAAVPSGPGQAGQAPVSRLLATGRFVSHEHTTTGTAQLVQLADRRRQVVLVNLATSDGPDLRVWLSDQNVTASGSRVFDDGRHLELGRLKGNLGNQVYDVPAGVDLSQFRSVTIWCKRFSVSFGAAELAGVGAPSASPS